MSKRLITILLTVFTVMLLTGCNGDQKAVSETAEGFLTAMVNNDLDAAGQYASEEFMNSETMKMMDSEYLADAFYAQMGQEKEDMGEEAQAAVDAYVQNVVKKAYKSFEIQEDSASVTAKITLGYDLEASSDVSEETIELVKEYQSEHYDELVSIYTEEGEKAMFKKIYNDLIPIIVGKMQEDIEKSSGSEEKTILTLQKTDGKWLVTDLEENRAGAETEETAGEGATDQETSK